MRIVICGSRNWTNGRMIWAFLETLADGVDPSSIEVVHGDAHGADRIAGSAAKALGFTVTPVPADWETYGKAAGPERNTRMVLMAPRRVVAFRRDGKSNGTDDMIRKSLRNHIHVTLFDERGEVRDLRG